MRDLRVHALRSWRMRDFEAYCNSAAAPHQEECSRWPRFPRSSVIKGVLLQQWLSASHQNDGERKVPPTSGNRHSVWHWTLKPMFSTDITTWNRYLCLCRIGIQSTILRSPHTSRHMYQPARHSVCTTQSMHHYTTQGNCMYYGIQTVAMTSIYTESKYSSRPWQCTPDLSTFNLAAFK